MDRTLLRFLFLVLATTSPIYPNRSNDDVFDGGSTTGLEQGEAQGNDDRSTTVAALCELYSGWLLDGGDCFVTLHRNMNWWDSRNACRGKQLGFKGDLLSSISQSNLYTLATIIFNQSPRHCFWIGGHGARIKGKDVMLIGGEITPGWISEPVNPTLALTFSVSNANNVVMEQINAYRTRCYPICQVGNGGGIIRTTSATSTGEADRNRSMTSTMRSTMVNEPGFTQSSTTEQETTEGSLVCPDESGWKSVESGKMQQKESGGSESYNCSEDYQAISFRECLASGKWDDVINTYCISNHLGSINIIEGDVETVGTALKDFVTSHTLSYGHEILTIMNLVMILTDRIEAELADKNITERDSTVRNYGDITLETCSQLLEEKNQPAWKQLKEDEKKTNVGILLEYVDSVGHLVSCNAKDVKNGVTINRSKMGLQAYALEPQEAKKGVVFPRPGDNPFQSITSRLDIHADFSQMNTSLASTCGNKLYSGVGTVYTGLERALAHNDHKGPFLNSPLIGFSLGKRNKDHILLPEGSNVTLIIQHLKRAQPENSLTCVFWNFTKEGWDTTGCTTTYWNATHTECSCDHLTNFAVVMSIRPPPNNLATKLLTISFSSLSCVALVMTISILAGFRSLHCRRSTITINLCINLLLVNLIILVGLDRTEIPVFCSLVAMSLHFVLLSSFMWMLMEGFVLYQMIVVVFSDVLNINFRFFYLVGYGVPLSIVSVSAGSRYSDYGNKYHCWLSSTRHLTWSFLGPALFVIFVNCVFLVAALRAAAHARVTKLHKTPKVAAGWVKGSFSMMCLLGITWLLGLFYVDENTEFFSYAFIVFNGLQGVLIFIFHVFLNEKARNALTKYYKGKREDSRRKFTRSTQQTRASSGSSYSSNKSTTPISPTTRY